MKKILQLTFVLLLAKVSLSSGQTNSSILNGPINIYPPTGDWTSSLNLFNPTKTNQFHITHDITGRLVFGYQGAGGHFTILGNGNIGFGTYTPSAKLTIADASPTLRLEATANPTGYYSEMTSMYDGSQPFILKVGVDKLLGVKRIVTGNINTISYINGRYGIGFSTETGEPTDATLKMYIASNGNVGIGTTSPITKLTVSGTFTPAHMQIAVKNNTLGEGIGISFNETNDARKGHIYAQSGNGLIIGDETGYGLRIFSGGSEVLTARNGGNVGIGTTNPTAKLDVNGTANFTNSILLSGGSGTVANKIGFNADASNYYIQGIMNGMQYSPYAVGNFSFTSGNGNWNFTNGNVGIGTIAFPTGYKLAVGGDIIAERVVVKLQTNWPDYVFTPNHHRASLQEIEKYINQNHHLPNIPSAQEVSEKGIDVGSMNTKFMEKIEELTLYLIEQNKKIEALEKKNAELENAIKNIKK